MDIYQEPDPNIEYKCSDNTISKGFTLLMKWVMLTKEHPELHDKIKEYIRDRPKEINKQNEKGLTALMMASRYSNGDSTENTVKMLIEAEANVDLQNNDGWTALMLASRNSKTESTENTVKMLIEAKSNVNLQEKDGWTALMMTSRYSNGDSTENTVKMLIEAKANVDLQNNDGWTALIMASRYSNGDSTENTVKMLIEAKANVDLQNNDGWTALMMACRYSNGDSTENTVKMLIEADDNLTMNKIIENKIPSNIAELCLNKIYVKNYLKQRFTRSIVKHIPLIVSEFKLKYGTLSQKIITYNLELKNTNDKKSIYNIIHDKDNKIIDYLDIKNENDMSKLTEYVNLL